MQIASASSQSKPEGTPQQRIQFFIFLLIGLCLVFGISYTGRVLAKVHMDDAVSAQIEENHLAQARTAQLQGRLAYVQSDAFAEEKAREEFSMAQPGDRKVVILSEAAAQPEVAPAPVLVIPPQPSPQFAPLQRPSPAVPSVDATLPIWRQWLTLLFP